MIAWVHCGRLSQMQWSLCNWTEGSNPRVLWTLHHKCNKPLMISKDNWIDLCECNQFITCAKNTQCLHYMLCTNSIPQVGNSLNKSSRFLGTTCTQIKYATCNGVNFFYLDTNQQPTYGFNPQIFPSTHSFLGLRNLNHKHIQEITFPTLY